MRNLFPFLIALTFPLAHAADSALDAARLFFEAVRDQQGAAAVAQLSIPDDQRDAFQKMIDDGDITRIFAEHGGIDHFSIDETGVKGEQQQLVRVAVHTKDGNSAPFGNILIIRTADRGWLVDSRSF
ncbi:MAG: hypothetical protein ACFN4D_09990 [Cardiobacterium sp.]